MICTVWVLVNTAMYSCDQQSIKEPYKNDISQINTDRKCRARLTDEVRTTATNAK